jgi:hypothetical protein
LYLCPGGDKITLLDPSGKIVASCEKVSGGKAVVLKGEAAAAAVSVGDIDISSSSSILSSVSKKRKSDGQATTDEDSKHRAESSFGQTPKRKRGISILNSLGTQNPEVFVEIALDSLPKESTTPKSSSNSVESNTSSGDKKNRNSSSSGTGVSLRSSDEVLRDGRRIFKGPTGL